MSVLPLEDTEPLRTASRLLEQIGVLDCVSISTPVCLYLCLFGPQPTVLYVCLRELEFSNLQYPYLTGLKCNALSDKKKNQCTV